MATFKEILLVYIWLIHRANTLTGLNLMIWSQRWNLNAMFPCQLSAIHCPVPLSTLEPIRMHMSVIWAEVCLWEPQQSAVIRLQKVRGRAGISSLIAFYHASHARFPDEYIKIITVQTEFLITDLLAIVLCVFHVFFPLLQSLPLSLSPSLPPLLHALFIYLHQWIQNRQCNVISIHTKMILKMPIWPIIQSNYKSVSYFLFLFDHIFRRFLAVWLSCVSGHYLQRRRIFFK